MPTSHDSQLDGIVLRDYREMDESSWISCRVQSFLDTSYRDDVQQYREVYANPSVCLVAVEEIGGAVVGFLDVEYEEKPHDVFHREGQRGGVLWHLGVLPGYRNRGIATALWELAKERLKQVGISRIEAWTQDDAPAVAWYSKQGFELQREYLNVYVRGMMGEFPLKDLLPFDPGQWKFGQIRNFNFEADISYREELEKLSYRIHTVRGLECKLA